MNYRKHLSGNYRLESADGRQFGLHRDGTVLPYHSGITEVLFQTQNALPECWVATMGCISDVTFEPKLEGLEKALKEHLPERHHRLLPLNFQALREGAKFAAMVSEQ